MKLFLVFVGLLFLSSCTYAAPAVAQAPAVCHVNPATTNPCTFSSVVAAGDEIAVLVEHGTCATNTFTDAQGNTYITTGTGGQVANSGTITDIFYAENVVGGTAETGTYNCGTSSESYVNMVDMSGTATSGSLDANCSSNTAGTTSSSDSCSITTNFSNDLVLSFEVDAFAAHNFTLGSGYSQCSSQTITGAVAVCENQVFSSSGAQTANWTWSANLSGEHPVLRALAFKAQVNTPGATLIGPKKVVGKVTIF